MKGFNVTPINKFEKLEKLLSEAHLYCLTSNSLINAKK